MRSIRKTTSTNNNTQNNNDNNNDKQDKEEQVSTTPDASQLDDIPNEAPTSKPSTPLQQITKPIADASSSSSYRRVSSKISVLSQADTCFELVPEHRVVPSIVAPSKAEEETSSSLTSNTSSLPFSSTKPRQCSPNRVRVAGEKPQSPPTTLHNGSLSEPEPDVDSDEEEDEKEPVVQPTSTTRSTSNSPVPRGGRPKQTAAVASPLSWRSRSHGNQPSPSGGSSCTTSVVEGQSVESTYSSSSSFSSFSDSSGRFLLQRIAPPTPNRKEKQQKHALEEDQENSPSARGSDPKLSHNSNKNDTMKQSKTLFQGRQRRRRRSFRWRQAKRSPRRVDSREDPFLDGLPFVSTKSGGFPGSASSATPAVSDDSSSNSASTGSVESEDDDISQRRKTPSPHHTSSSPNRLDGNDFDFFDSEEHEVEHEEDNKDEEEVSLWDDVAAAAILSVESSIDDDQKNKASGPAPTEPTMAHTARSSTAAVESHSNNNDALSTTSSLTASTTNANAYTKMTQLISRERSKNHRLRPRILAARFRRKGGGTKPSNNMKNDNKNGPVQEQEHQQQIQGHQGSATETASTNAPSGTSHNVKLVDSHETGEHEDKSNHVSWWNALPFRSKRSSSRQAGSSARTNQHSSAEEHIKQQLMDVQSDAASVASGLFYDAIHPLMGVWSNTSTQCAVDVNGYVFADAEDEVRNDAPVIHDRYQVAVGEENNDAPRDTAELDGDKEKPSSATASTTSSMPTLVRHGNGGRTHRSIAEYYRQGTAMGSLFSSAAASFDATTVDHDKGCCAMTFLPDSMEPPPRVAGRMPQNKRLPFPRRNRDRYTTDNMIAEEEEDDGILVTDEKSSSSSPTAKHTPSTTRSTTRDLGEEDDPCDEGSQYSQGEDPSCTSSAFPSQYSTVSYYVDELEPIAASYTMYSFAVRPGDE